MKGCDFVQGYIFANRSRPNTVPGFIETTDRRDRSEEGRATA